MGLWEEGCWMYEGMVLSISARYFSDDDRPHYEARVWNPAEKKVFLRYARSSDVADASPALLAEVERVALERAVAKEAAAVRKGKRVKVVRGRKVPKGTEGVVIWMGSSRYGYKVTKRVGLKDESGAVHWTAEDNVEVVAA